MSEPDGSSQSLNRPMDQPSGTEHRARFHIDTTASRSNPSLIDQNQRRSVSFVHDRDDHRTIDPLIKRSLPDKKEPWGTYAANRLYFYGQFIECGSSDILERKQSAWSSRASSAGNVGAFVDQGKLLVELYELQTTKRRGVQWRETARWIKYEERVEGVDKFWSKPRVPYLSFHSLTQLRLCFMKGVILLNQDADSYDDLLELIVTDMGKEYQIDENRLGILRDAVSGYREGKSSEPANSKSAVGFVAKKVSSLARQHTTTAFEIEQHKPLDIVKPGDRKMIRMQTSALIQRPPNQNDQQARVGGSTARRVTRIFKRDGADDDSGYDVREDAEFLKRLPQGVQGVQVLTGSVQDIAHVRFAMCRLTNAQGYPEFRKGQVPMKFLFILVGPPSDDIDYHEVGRSLATLMANPTFQTAALVAEHRKDLVDAIDTFLDEGIVVPPVDIDKGVANVDDIKKALRNRSKTLGRSQEHILESVKEGVVLDSRTPTTAESNEQRKKELADQDNPLQRTGKLFGGLIRDVQKRAPYYWSDFRDALNVQCITSVCFMFFAAMAPAITFGGLLENKTQGWMGTSEVLVAQSICGIIWSLFSAQPMLIMAATGPFLIFEGSLFEFCDSQHIDFMIFRVWAGFWVFLAAFITVMLEGSFLIRYFTRFTEDIFASLVALIFIVESLKFVFKSFIYHPVTKMGHYCGSYIKHGLLEITEINNTEFHGIFNSTQEFLTMNISQDNVPEALAVPEDDHGHHGELKGQPDTALLSAILVIGTFYLSYQFRQLRTTIFLGRPLRRLISDFGVPLAIFIVVVVDFTAFTQPYVQHLVMSDTFSPTSPEKRGWFIYPFADEQHSFPIWAYFASSLPALLVYILIFVECELTQLLLLRPERKLQKGGGFHWDLLLLGALTLMCSLMGLPWMCAAVLQSLAHGSSLTITKNRAPGQPPQVERVVEQRVTTLVISVLTGACAFLGFVLKEIPIAVLFGVFLFLGVMTLSGVDMTNRLVLMFVPQKYFPDHPYCQNVAMWRMHLYTLIQLLCLGLMWTCKSIQLIALAFPFMLMVIALFRIFVLPKIFKEHELEALDGEEELHEDEDGEIDIFRHMAV